MDLAKNVEELVCLGGEDDRLLSAKREFFGQMTKFRITITAKRFFELDRPLLATVRKIICSRLFFLDKLFPFQFASACCTYVIICVQFDYATQVNCN